MVFPTVSQISANRVIVRPVGPADLTDLLEVNGDEEVTRFVPYPTWTSVADGTAWLERMQGLAAGGTAQQLVIERTEDQRVIGAVLLFKYEASSSRLELGYVLGRKHWRMGLASEALRALCGHLFVTGAVRRIEAEVNPDNTASCALLARLGFSLEGRLRKRWVAKGRVYDVNFYGCLSEEWPTSPVAA